MSRGGIDGGAIGGRGIDGGVIGGRGVVGGPAGDGVDALARIEPVARPLLAQVDAALSGLGAPAGHPVWARLRALGATPAAAVAFFAGLHSQPLRAAAARVLDQAETYDALIIPADLPWAGAAGEAYRVLAAALAEHLHGAGPGSLAGRLRASAVFLNQTATFVDHSRQRIARALAEVISSRQALTLRAGLMLAGAAAGTSVLAAADIGAHVLAAAGDALAQGRDLLADGPLDELTFVPPAGAGALSTDAALRVPD